MTNDNQRRGPLSSQEKLYIKTNAGNMLPEDIAKELQRNPKSILNYIKDTGLLKFYKEDELSGNEVKLDKLKKTPYWENYVINFLLLNLNFYNTIG